MQQVRRIRKNFHTTDRVKRVEMQFKQGSPRATWHQMRRVRIYYATGVYRGRWLCFHGDTGLTSERNRFYGRRLFALSREESRNLYKRLHRVFGKPSRKKKRRG
jgi:hypothetical protein